MNVVNKANSLCPTLWALKPVAQVPRGQVLTFVDLGPRLITVTHHDAVAGPYHRNGARHHRRDAGLPRHAPKPPGRRSSGAGSTMC